MGNVKNEMINQMIRVIQDYFPKLEDYDPKKIEDKIKLIQKDWGLTSEKAEEYLNAYLEDNYTYKNFVMYWGDHYENIKSTFEKNYKTSGKKIDYDGIKKLCQWANQQVDLEKDPKYDNKAKNKRFMYLALVIESYIPEDREPLFLIDR